DIHPPELETKLAILEKKAEEEQIPLPNDVKHFLATNITSNVRELEGALIGLGAMASLSGKQITIELAQEILKNIVMKEEETVTIEEIQRTVAEFYNLRVSHLRSNNRQKDIVHARQVAMYLARIITNESYPHISTHFNKKDHTTVIHACRQIKQKMKSDESLRYIIDMLRKQIEKEK
ncbi:MAG: chromosomal replication initiator protein DnaA, partial [Deltaproteobacteria bacterium]